MAKVLTEARCPPRRGFFFVALGTRRKRKTGFWLEEFAAPYYHFKGAGAEIVLASPKGGQPPLDLKSNEPNFQTELTHRFETDAAEKAQLASAVRLDNVEPQDFDTVFYPGGHGPMWDLAEDQNSIKLIEGFLAADKPRRPRLSRAGRAPSCNDA
jgi:putative intracellular protease/amidase